MDFYNALKKTQNNVSVTENGMVGYKTTYHPLADMNFRLPAYRKDKNKLLADLKEVMNSNDKEYILKYLFFVRDVREGLGERSFFKTVLTELARNYEFEGKDEIMTAFVVNDIQEYGRFDDLFALVDTKYEDLVMKKLKDQLNQDFDNMKNGKSISLLAKWMPSVNTSSNKTKELAKKIVKAFGCSPKEYRQLLSALRNHLKVVEVTTSANKWGEVDYNAVPSKANLKYNNAFLKHDEQRRRDYLAALRLGVDLDGKAVKINSSVNYPHEIVSKYTPCNGYSVRFNAYDETLEQLWKNLAQKQGLEDAIVVRDGSGSMTVKVGGNTTALDIATALAIYCSERLNGCFKDKFITFSRVAKLIDLSKQTSLIDKIKETYRQDACENTNIESVFNLILKTAITNKLSAEDMPKSVLIISDMEFDYGCTSFASTLFDDLAIKYKQAGYQLPKLVFWNVNSRTNTIPMVVNDLGVILVSGFSVNILDLVMSGKVSPYEALLDKLNEDRYAKIPLLKVGAKKNTVSSKNVKEKPNWL